MGLEYVELIMDIENEFGIEIKDEHASQIRTVGQLYELICQKYDYSKGRNSESQKIFYQLKGALVSILQINEEQVHPEASTADFFPEKNRKAYWDQISKAAQLEFPKLITRIYFTTIGWILIAMTLLIGIMAVLQVPFIIWLICWVLFGSLLAYVIGTASGYSSRPQIPLSCQTIDGLTRTLTRLNCEPGKPYDKDQIWALLVHMVAEIACCDEEEIKPETRFIEDLDFG